MFIIFMSLNVQAKVEPFESAPKEGAEFDGKFCWAGPKDRFVFGAHGDIRSAQEKQRTVSLPLNKEEYIEMLWVLSYQSSVLVAYETFDGEGGRGAVCRFSEDFSRQMWCQEIQGFNVFVGMSDVADLYVASIGFIGRINVKTGAYVWQQPGLYEKDEAFNVIGHPEEDGDKIKFYASSGMGSAGKYISLQRDTGDILAIGNANADKVASRQKRSAGHCQPED
jgi:hypothetical protein